jgi:hypothetical protein
VTVSASTFNVPFEALLDRTAYLKRRTIGAEDYVRSVALTRVASSGFDVIFDGISGLMRGYEQTVAPANTYLMFAIPALWIPGRHVIKTVEIKYLPATGHGALPEFLPVAQFSKADASATATLLADDADGAGSVGIYESQRSIALSVDYEPVEFESYHLRFTGESGNDSDTGLIVTSIDVIYGAL